MSIENLTIGFIGGGNMARAIVAGLLRAGHRPTRLVVAEPDESQRGRIAALNADVVLARSNSEVARAVDILVLAVKPQVMATVLSELASAKRPAHQLLLSVAAGITLDTLARGLGGAPPAVRVMPNQPALVGEGMAALVASAAVSAAQRDQAFQVAAATGRAIWLADESLMDAVTAVSGSGPAYFYMLMEMMEDSAVALGLPRDVARTLVRQTALGAARVASDPALDVAGLRSGVTSPGGTTAAALAVMEQAGIRAILRRALAAARDRGIELGRGSK